MQRCLVISASSENKGGEQGLMGKHMQRLVSDVMAMRTEEKTVKERVNEVLPSPGSRVCMGRHHIMESGEV
ncbi:hypothetical protein CMV_024978 [Castanea mollissima]|uniref:Uncharacterized protein n=1 Tax=Castanea mollissima TaxID=60419 RepID=A0A8J4QDX6_9ROSI|nr:hypothetical protein CMV_024978 [Castanea mollissima]